jgi:hypothetical protein
MFSSFEKSSREPIDSRLKAGKPVVLLGSVCYSLRYFRLSKVAAAKANRTPGPRPVSGKFVYIVGDRRSGWRDPDFRFCNTIEVYKMLCQVQVPMSEMDT